MSKKFLIKINFKAKVQTFMWYSTQRSPSPDTQKIDYKFGNFKELAKNYLKNVWLFGHNSKVIEY